MAGNKKLLIFCHCNVFKEASNMARMPPKTHQEAEKEKRAAKRISERDEDWRNSIDWENEQERVAKKTYPFILKIVEKLNIFKGKPQYGQTELPEVYGQLTDVYSAKDDRNHRYFVEVRGFGGDPHGGFDSNEQPLKTNQIRLRILVFLTPDENKIRSLEVYSVVHNVTKGVFEGFYTSEAELYKKLIPPYFF